MAMDKIKYILIIIVILIAVFFIPTNVTPKNYGFLSDDLRKNMIKSLDSKCHIEYAIKLSIYYKKFHNDVNAYQCWLNFAVKCKKRDDNITLPPKHNCPIY